MTVNQFRSMVEAHEQIYKHLRGLVYPIMWVCRTPEEAAELQESMRDPPNVKFTAQGALLVGTRVHTVILDNLEDMLIDKATRADYRKWYETVLKRKMMPGGRIIRGTTQFTHGAS